MKPGLIAILFCLCFLNAAAQDKAPDSTGQAPVGALMPIAALDVPRYMGTWYEIAKFPNRFQKMCVGNTQADYSLMTDGRVKVINRCILESGEINEAIGAARQVGAPTSAKLKVRFAPAWLSFIPAVWGDYWVIDLDENYQLAAVSEPDREYLWILSRTPKLDQKSYESLLNRLREKGFDLQKLEITKQEN